MCLVLLAAFSFSSARSRFSRGFLLVLSCHGLLVFLILLILFFAPSFNKGCSANSFFFLSSTLWRCWLSFSTVSQKISATSTVFSSSSSSAVAACSFHTCYATTVSFRSNLFCYEVVRRNTPCKSYWLPFQQEQQQEEKENFSHKLLSSSSFTDFSLLH